MFQNAPIRLHEVDMEAEDVLNELNVLLTETEDSLPGNNISFQTEYQLIYEEQLY